MMPAASNIIETKPSAEALDPTKQFISLLEKKVRNIEKRKSKLDAVRAKKDAGETLEKEQKEAITHYDSVVTNLEFARELQKNFGQLMADLEKQQRKQAKREKMEKAASEVKRVVEVLQVQTTLDSMGADNVRQHFKTGKYGAVVLTEDNLTSLDELYQLISPSRDTAEGNFEEKLGAAGEHFVNLLESRDRAVAGSTYKELMELINLINGCGYFERAREAEEASAAVEASEEAAEEKTEEESISVAPTSAESFPEAAESDLQNNAAVQQSVSDLEENALSHQQVLPTAVPQPDLSHSSYFTQPPTTAAHTAFQPQPTQPPEPIATKARPLPEIISSVRGTFSFLQDSEIEIDSPHMDPAVVAAQPMLRQPPTASQLAGGFPAPPMVDPTLDGEAADPLSLSQQSLTQSNLDFSGASQSFAQAGLSHSQTLPSAPVNDGLFQSPVDAAGSQGVAQSQSMLGQGRGAGEPSGAPFDLPPSIPMPPSQAQQDANQMSGQEKKFQLNASATEFQSRTMYHPQMPPKRPVANVTQPPPPQPPSQAPHQPTPPQMDPSPLPPPNAANPDFPPAQNFAQAAGDFVNGNFQGGNFQRGGRGGGNNSGPGNYRGGQRGGRGGNNMGNNMQNGFNPRPQNGTSRPNNRGGATFQGFPPRNDYRPDGFQGYNTNGFSNPNPAFQKRGGGGGGGGGQGFPRGGSGGNRGATGMQRGGPPRTGPPRGAANVRGSMTRPTNQ